MKDNIDRPSQADIFNPRGGRITNVNSLNLPILRDLQLSAVRGVLYRPQRDLRHKGSAHVQLVDNFGRSAFDGELHEGQIFVVPQNFAEFKKAGSQGFFEWIAVMTNDLAVRSPLAGRISTIRAMPEDVLVNAFRISREQARCLKNNREKVSVFTPSLQGSRD
ncbi:hypothetical protein TIFTF001_022548 [Ficus carica]|uniref:Cupin type-1 domain-containing protein n=1 Tax=Ficus carica TaxID=3494 RepID=A0AA88AEP6_FICCA|nr:hypothetical protein TIFTF001_022548 [Ficus carica]